MAVTQSEVETLLAILESIDTPEMLDAHPWVFRTFVKDAIVGDAGLQGAGPGRQLVGSIEKLFSQTMPSIPPRRGKRLDTRWGEFGLIAARFIKRLFYPVKRQARFLAQFFKGEYVTHGVIDMVSRMAFKMRSTDFLERSLV